MPQSEGGYISLEGAGASVNGIGGAIYQSTTEPTGPQSVFEKMKSAIGQVVGNGSNAVGGVHVAAGVSHDTEELLHTKNSRQPIIVGSSTMPVDPMDDIELRSVQLQFPNGRGSIMESCEQHRVPTDKGEIHVAVQGDTSKPAILTYHDLGLNYVSSFAGFFNFPLMRGLLENFCVYHVTAPGQEEGAPTLPEDYVYPTMDDLAAQLLFVLSHFGLKSVIGFGVGAGANILARFAIAHPDKVGALCLINCISTQSGWIEWGYQSFNARFLRTKGMTQSVVDYLMWHHFGRNPEERNCDLVQMYKQHFERGVNPTNLAMFINSYIHRNDLNIARSPPTTPGTQPTGTTLKMPVINVTGALSPHVDDTVTFNGRLDPTNSSWMKISDCAMVLEEQPAKLAEAFRLFLQGEGYATPLSTPAISPCGNKYQTYSTIFFANFREEQLKQRLLQKQQEHQLQQKQIQFKFRSTVRPCRETAINNINNNLTHKVEDTPIMEKSRRTTQYQALDFANGNGIENFTYPDALVNVGDTSLNTAMEIATEQQLPSDVELQHSVNGTLYTSIQTSKIRITENPLPEPVSC